MCNERLNIVVMPWYRLWTRIQEESTTFGAARRLNRDPIMTDIFYTISASLKETINEK